MVELTPFNPAWYKDVWVCLEARGGGWLKEDMVDVIFHVEPYVEHAHYTFNIPSKYCTDYTIGWGFIKISEGFPLVLYRKLLEPHLQPQGAGEYIVTLTNVKIGLM